MNTLPTCLPSPNFPNHLKKSIISKTNCVSKACTESPPSSPPLFQPLLSFNGADPFTSISLNYVKQIHTHLIKTDFNANSETSTFRLFDMYSQVGDFRSAAMVFLTGFDRRCLSWEGERPLFELLDGFAESCRRGICFGEGALAAVLKVCAASMEVWLGLEIHAWVIKKGLDSNTHLRSALMDFYEDCLGSEHAEALFDEMTVRNPFLFKKAIALSTRSGTWYKNLIFLREMHSSGFKADNITIARVLQACGRLEALREGAQIHGYAMRSGAAFDLLVCNSLISMYSKNSVVEKAGKVFELMRDRSSASWNSLLSGYTLNGFLDEAWKLFDRMSLSNMKPDLVTWNCLISGEFLHGSMNGALMVVRMMQSEGFKPNSSSMTRVLQTISDSGSLDLGKEAHGYVMRNGHADDIYIGTSLIDMYLKCGSLSSARKVFDGIEGRIPSHGIV